MALRLVPKIETRSTAKESIYVGTFLVTQYSYWFLLSIVSAFKVIVVPTSAVPKAIPVLGRDKRSSKRPVYMSIYSVHAPLLPALA